MSDSDSSGDGLCGGDSSSKKIRIWIFKNAEPGVLWKDSKLVQKSSSVVVVIEGFGGGINGINEINEFNESNEFKEINDWD